MRISSGISFRSILLLAIVMALGACRLTLTHDIVLKDANSGEITLTAEVVYDRVMDDSDPPDEEHPLHDYVEYAEDFAGITVVDETTEDLSDETNFHYVYQIRAEFDDLDDLSEWIAVQDTYGFETEQDEETTTLTIHPQLFYLSSQPVMDEAFGSYSSAEIESFLNITTPGYIQDTDEAAQVTHDGKTARWQVTVDEDFYNGEDILWSISY